MSSKIKPHINKFVPLDNKTVLLLNEIHSITFTTLLNTVRYQSMISFQFYLVTRRLLLFLMMESYSERNPIRLYRFHSLATK